MDLQNFQAVFILLPPLIKNFQSQKSLLTGKFYVVHYVFTSNNDLC